MLKTGLRVAFFGSPSFAVPILATLVEQVEVVLVVTQPAKPVGKGQHIQLSAVNQFALSQELEVLTPTRFKDETTKAALTAIPVDLGIVAAYGKILPHWCLVWPRLGMINVHASLLPKYRGASPIQAAILAGETETGITFMQMNERMDEGDILRQHPQPLSAKEMAPDVSERLAKLAADRLPSLLDDYISGQIEPVPQEANMATYTKVLEKDDGLIDLANLPADLERRIRAYYPWPGVWGWFDGQRVKFLPGGLIQLEGKRPVQLTDFLHGHPNFPVKEIPA